MNGLTAKNTKISASKRGAPIFDGDPERMQPSEVISYYLDPKDIEKKYGPPIITEYKLTCLLEKGNSITKIGKMFGIPGNVVNDLIVHYQIKNKIRR